MNVESIIEKEMGKKVIDKFFSLMDNLSIKWVKYRNKGGKWSEFKIVMKEKIEDEFGFPVKHLMQKPFQAIIETRNYDIRFRRISDKNIGYAIRPR